MSLFSEVPLLILMCFVFIRAVFSTASLRLSRRDAKEMILELFPSIKFVYKRINDLNCQDAFNIKLFC